MIRGRSVFANETSRHDHGGMDMQAVRKRTVPSPSTCPSYHRHLSWRTLDVVVMLVLDGVNAGQADFAVVPIACGGCHHVIFFDAAARGYVEKLDR